MTVDSHHHFWLYDAGQYPWIPESSPTLRRDFLPADLHAEMKAAGIDGVVSVQARQTLEETRWLLELADANDFIRGVVGWAPLTSPGVHEDLERFAHLPRLKSIRHVLQDEPDDYMLRPDFDHGIGLLKDFELRYDLLITERQLPQAIQLVDKHPRLTFILDHIAKPRIRDGALSPWRQNLGELARRPNVYCKLSGIVTEADHSSWTERQIEPYMIAALEAFGPKRLMFGSDWPVCLLACDYRRWHALAANFAARLSPDERSRIMGGTAVEAYGLT